MISNKSNVVVFIVLILVIISIIIIGAYQTSKSMAYLCSGTEQLMGTEDNTRLVWFNAISLLVVILVLSIFYHAFVMRSFHSRDENTIKKLEIQNKTMQSQLDDYNEDKKNNSKGLNRINKDLRKELLGKTRDFEDKLKKESKSTTAMIYILERAKRTNIELEASKEMIQKSQKELEVKNKALQTKSKELMRTNIELKKSEEDSEQKRKKLLVQSKKLKEVNRNIIEAEKQLSLFNVRLERKVMERTRQLEKERNRISGMLKQKTEFINQLSHDIRTPLTPIITLVSVLKYKIKDKKLQSRLDIISKNADYLKSLVVNTLNLAKLDLSKVEFNYVNEQMHSMISELITLNAVVFKERKIKAINKIDPQIKVRCDILRIKEVFENLIMNAIKFMPNGGKITFSSETSPKSYILSVKDTGIGMRPEIQDRIFDEFFKADESRHIHSSGLGLTISKRIIEKHKGKIWAESKGPGKGSTFYIKLPM